MTSPNPFAPPRAAVIEAPRLGEHETTFDYLKDRAPLDEAAQIVRKSGWLLFGVPVFLTGLAMLGGILSLVYNRTDDKLYEFGVLLCIPLGVFANQYMLGRTAALFGSRWLVYTVLPLFFAPAILVCRLILLDKHLKLRDSVASRRRLNGTAQGQVLAQTIKPSAAAPASPTPRT